MCDSKHELWLTPEKSKYLSSKQVILHPGESMPEHTTGPGREEVIICMGGCLSVIIGKKRRTLHFADTAFIPENTKHQIDCKGKENASYVYVVTKKAAYSDADARKRAAWLPGSLTLSHELMPKG